MQAIRTFIWIILAVALTVFAITNSQLVSVRVWPGYLAEMPLSLLIIVVFLAGFLPPFLLNMGNRWRLGRRINQQEATIAQLRTPVAEPVTPVAAPLTSEPGAPV